MSLYLVCYALTLAVHAVLIGYVLAGAGYAAIAAVRGRSDGDPIAAALRDWLPFALGAAITAGVAPLLFVQILYQERFYTANLLLFHRWMAIVPVLIASFYALYLHKSDRVTRPAARAAVIAFAFGGFVFVAWSWTENHLLSLDQPVWRDFYAAGRMIYTSDQLAPRLLMWLFAALPSLAAFATWQIRSESPAVRRLALLAVIGVIGSSACAGWLWTALPAASRDGVLAAPLWLYALGAARAVEVIGWTLLVRRPDSRAILALATAGTGAAVLAGVAVREGVRLHLLEAIRPRVESAGGLAAFLISAALMIAALVWIGRRVRGELVRNGR